jgi:hypothetical protein
LFPTESCAVCVSKQVAPFVHVPLTHTLSTAQSAPLSHVVLHAAGPHAYAAQAIVVGIGHAPRPSQFAAAVAMPSVQLALRHATPDPTKPAQIDRCVPSQRGDAHGSPAGVAGQSP